MHVLTVLHTVSHKNGGKGKMMKRGRKAIGKKSREMTKANSSENPRKAAKYIIARE